MRLYGAYSVDLRNLRSDKPDTTQKRANRWFAPTRHTERCLLTADRTAFLFFEGITSPFAPLFPPLKGGWGGCFSAFGTPCTRHNIIQLLMVNCQLSIVMLGTRCRDAINCVSTVRTALICVICEIRVRINPTPHKKRANTRFAPTLTTLITVDYFSLFTLHSSLFTFHSSLFVFHFSLYKNFGYPFS